MKKRIFSIIICLTILLVFLTACNTIGTTTTQTTNSGVQTNQTTTISTTNAKPVKITALVASSQLPAESNSVQKEISKRLGIDFQPIHVENTAYQERFNTLAAAKALPDVFLYNGYVWTMQLIKDKVVIPLDDLLKQYGQDVTANKSKFLEKNIARVDGKLYGIPTAAGSPSALVIRKDWLDNLGMQVPTDTESYYQVLKAFTKSDPDKDGQNDTIGLAMNVSFPTTQQPILGAFGVSLGRPALVDGKVVPYFMHPGYIHAIKYYRKLYQEGLVEPDFATIPNMTLLQKLWNGTYGSYFGDPIGTTNNWIGRYTEKPAPVMTYTYIKGPDGFSGGSKIIRDSNFTGISSTCKNPDYAMKFINYLHSEKGNELTYAGIEGVHWKWENNKLVYLAPYTDASAHRNDGGFAYNYIAPRYQGMEYKILNELTQFGLKVADEHVVDDAYIYVAPEAEKNITFNTDAMFSSLIVTKGDVDAEYKTFVNDYLANGGSKWIEQATVIYNKK